MSKIKESLIALQNDEKYAGLDERTRVGIIQALQAELEDLDAEGGQYTREEVVRALRYMLSQEDKNELLSRKHVSEGDPISIDDYYDPFYIPYGYNWAFTDILIMSYILHVPHYVMPVSSAGYAMGGGCCSCGCGSAQECSGEAVLAVCALLVIASSIACTIGTGCNTASTIRGRESNVTKALKTTGNIASFAVPVAGLLVLARFFAESITASTGLSKEIYWLCAVAVALAAGGTASLITSCINKYCECLPRVKLPSQALLNELSVIQGLLNGEWVGGAKTPAEKEMLRRFIREAIKVYIEGRYQPRVQVEEAPQAPQDDRTRLLPQGSMQRSYSQFGVMGDSNKKGKEEAHIVMSDDDKSYQNPKSVNDL